MTWGAGVQEIPQRLPMYQRMRPLVVQALIEGGPMTSREIYERTLLTRGKVGPTHIKLIWYLKRMKIDGELVKVSQGKSRSARIIWGLP